MKDENLPKVLNTVDSNEAYMHLQTQNAKEIASSKTHIVRKLQKSVLNSQTERYNCRVELCSKSQETE